MKKLIAIAVLIGSIALHSPLIADGLDDLDGLAEGSLDGLSELDSKSEGDGLGGLSELDSGGSLESEDSFDSDSESKLSISFGGYLKGLTYWNEERYSDTLWNENFAAFSAAGKDIPEDQHIHGYNNVGTRMQFKVEAFLEDKARLFTAINVNYNIASSLHDSSSDSESQTDLRLVESFIEIYEERRTWKVGSQIITWSFLEGVEVPTDRVNARDYSYKSTEYEDAKLPSTGLLLTQQMFERSSFDLMFIPVAKTNVTFRFQDYFYPEEEETVEERPYTSKLATRFSSSLGSLDYAISYVEGTDPKADLQETDLILSGLDPDTGDLLYTVNFTGKKYYRVRSPGLDLQYDFGSLLAKASYVQYLTQDPKGTDYFIKNNWSKYVVGAEFKLFGSTVNLYAGQEIIENFQDDYVSNQTNFLLGQFRERTDFLSGHINADFLTGDALNVIIMAAGYWDKEGEPVQAYAKATFKYKLGDGLDLIFSPGYLEIMRTVLVDYQAEVKYSF